MPKHSCCMHSPGRLPALIVSIALGAMLLHGPIPQLADYHHFADQREWFGVAHAADVLSNLGFALVGIYGLLLLGQPHRHPRLQQGRAGYALFFTALLLTALGSGWYHLMPDNERLVWDRLPIALACAGLLAAVCTETLAAHRRAHWIMPTLAAIAVFSVAWWRYTDLHGVGDLRPYLLLQFMPLVLIPLLQWQHRAPNSERRTFALAIGCYVLAKICELADHAIFDTLTVISGHTLKHLLATLASGVIAWGLVSLRQKSM